MTLRDVAACAGVSLSYLSRVENGQVTPSAKWVHMVLDEIGLRIKAAA